MNEENNKKKRSRKKKENSKIHSPFELFGTEGLDNDCGWAGLIRPLMYRIDEYNKNVEDVQEKAIITQIKEKYGGLCFYAHLPTDYLSEQRDMVEDASYHICMICGSPYHVGITNEGWVETLCRVCAKKKYGKDFLEVWKECYDSVQITPIILAAIRLQGIWGKIKEIINHSIYLLYYKWCFNRKLKHLIKYDFISVKTKLPPINVIVDIRTNKRGWDGVLKGVLLSHEEKNWQIAAPVGWDIKETEYVVSWRFEL